MVLLSACAANQTGVPGADTPKLSFDDSRFGERPQVVGVADIFALSDEQQRRYIEYFDDPSRRDVPAHRRVYEYLELVTSDFDFHSDTNTAAEALASSEGNCLSLAIVTTALADLVGVDVGYHLVNSSPVFELNGSVARKGIHVRSFLYDPSWQPGGMHAMTFRRPGIQVDYFRDGTERFVSNLSKPDYIAMYYSNIAGEALMEGGLDTAYWYARESLAMAPDNAPALNTLAVTYRHAGDEVMAERIYRYGIDYLPDKVSFLRNYSALLKHQGRFDEAGAISEQLARLDEPNPIEWVAAARKAYSKGEFRDAVSYYKRAIDIAPYLHEAHSGMAMAYFQLGDTRRGERALRRALDNAQRRDMRSLYEAKLTSLGH